MHRSKKDAILFLVERSTIGEWLVYYDFIVDVPYGRGKVYKVFRRARNATYIELELSSTYLKDRHYTVAKRAQIGKLCGDDGSKMNPNENYFKLFPDAGSVSAYATDALSWCVANGIVNGTLEHGTAYLDPQGSATRAQVATLMSRYLKLTEA